MSRIPPEIRCMLIPLRAGRLLLPSASVAEVIGYREPEPVAGAPAWLQGKVNWQQRDLPVIDFERLLGQGDAAAGIRQRIVVCFAPDATSGWPLFGLVSQGIPRLLRLGEQAIGPARGSDWGESAVHINLSVGGEEMMVPDLGYLQAQLPAF